MQSALASRARRAARPGAALALVGILLIGAALGALRAPGSDSASLPTVSLLGLAGGNGSGVFFVIATAAPSTAVAPAEIYFNASVTGGVAPYTYRWTFGDGGNGSGQFPTHLYRAAGTYEATVEVTDSTDRTTNGSVPVTLSSNRTGENQSVLVLNFSANPSRGTAPLNVTFQFSASGGKAPYSLVICSTEDTCGFDLTNWSGAPEEDTSLYPAPGNYSATATLEDGADNQSIVTIPIVVASGTPLNVTALESTGSGPAPYAVGFVALVSGGTAPYTIQWNWGDGTVGSSAGSAVVIHVYAGMGLFHPTLTVTDAASHSVSRTLGAVNVTASASVSTAKSSGILPSGGSTLVVLEYLGIAAVGAVVSGVGVGLLLRQRHRQKEGARLVSELETTANRGPPDPSNGAGSER